MKNRNCPNCSAPLELGNYKCAYCGTLYLDLSMIDFDNNTPFFLTIKKDGYAFTQKVMPQTADMTATSNVVYASNARGRKLSVFNRGMDIETNVQFIALPIDKENGIISMITLADDE